MKTCKKCNVEKHLGEYYTAGTYKGIQQYRGVCAVCMKATPKPEKYKEKIKAYKSTDEYKEKRKAWRSQPHVQAKARAYEKANAKQRNPVRRARAKERYREDIFFRLRILCRQRTREMLRANDWQKNNKFKDYIGCSLEDLTLHIEGLFAENMSREHLLSGAIHIDHIIPLSSAKTVDELYKLCHYTNLQPLWAIDNLKKSDKMPGEQ